jgi:hypothetical protein
VIAFTARGSLDNHSMCVGVPLGSFLLGHYSAATRGGQK